MATDTHRCDACDEPARRDELAVTDAGTFHAPYGCPTDPLNPGRR